MKVSVKLTPSSESICEVNAVAKTFQKHEVLQ